MRLLMVITTSLWEKQRDKDGASFVCLMVLNSIKSSFGTRKKNKKKNMQSVLQSSHIPSVCHLLKRAESLTLKMCCTTNIYGIAVILMQAGAWKP